MAPITASIEIARSPEDVFAYLGDLARHVDWQEHLVDAVVQGDGPTKVGTTCTETRRVGGREQTATYEVTEYDPPTGFGFRGIDGPIRVAGKGTVEPAGDGSSSQVSITLDFTGHGFGKLLLPMVRSQARKQVPKDQQRLKERLEGGA
jgi:Polyketide cyclase / dehydrase and lipid transport